MNSNDGKCWECGAVLDDPDNGWCSEQCHAETMREERSLARGDS